MVTWALLHSKAHHSRRIRTLNNRQRTITKLVHHNMPFTLFPANREYPNSLVRHHRVLHLRIQEALFTKLILQATRLTNLPVLVELVHRPLLLLREPQRMDDSLLVQRRMGARKTFIDRGVLVGFY